METQIREWLNIQNITVEKPYNKMMVEELGMGQEDICNLLTIDKCLYAEPLCAIKDNKCINNDRLKPMHQKNITIISRLDKIPYVVLESRHITNIAMLTTNIQIYYVVLRSIATGNIYVLFSSGVVLTRDNLFDNPQITESLTLLVARLQLISSNKIAICGHSMGSALAMYTGYLFKTHYPAIFTRRCILLGTGIAKCVLPGFENLHNVRQFISGELRKTKTKPKLIIDCMVTKGDPTLYLYDPIEYIYSATPADDGPVEYLSMDSKEAAELFSVTIGNENQCKKLHKWTYYTKILTELFNVPIQFNRQKKTISNSKSKTSKARPPRVMSRREY